MTDKLKFKLKSAPKKPGCYLWKDEHGDIIYVGKAINIFNRVHQYFNRLHDYKTSQLVADIADVEFFVVKNENEALILENNLIKKHRPKYNILLKDSSGYPYIVITKGVALAHATNKVGVNTTGISLITLKKLHSMSFSLFDLLFFLKHLL